MSALPTLPPTHGEGHSWQLRGVDFDAGVEVSLYECDSCDEVWYA